MTFGGNDGYNFRMPRPTKDPRLRMDIDLRVPVTADQKELIAKALADSPEGFATGARQILLRAAENRLGNRKQHPSATTDEGNVRGPSA